jgi:hypothetical protein
MSARKGALGNDGPSKVPVGSLRSSRIADEIGKLRPLFEDGMYRAYTTTGENAARPRVPEHQ